MKQSFCRIKQFFDKRFPEKKKENLFKKSSMQFEKYSFFFLTIIYWFRVILFYIGTIKESIGCSNLKQEIRNQFYLVGGILSILAFIFIRFSKKDYLYRNILFMQIQGISIVNHLISYECKNIDSYNLGMLNVFVAIFSNLIKTGWFINSIIFLLMDC